jgi:hypothetical protein
MRLAPGLKARPPKEKLRKKTVGKELLEATCRKRTSFCAASSWLAGLKTRHYTARGSVGQRGLVGQHSVVAQWFVVAKHGAAI